MRPSPRDDHIARDADRLVDEWREACRIPSVTGDREPVERMAAWVEERVRRRFDRVVVEQTPDGVPVVLGELRGTGPGRLVVYTHYDVQPPGDLAAWDSDPFGAELRDGAVWGKEDNANAVMAGVATYLSDQDIEALATYIEGLHHAAPASAAAGSP